MDAGAELLGSILTKSGVRAATIVRVASGLAGRLVVSENGVPPMRHRRPHFRDPQHRAQCTRDSLSGEPKRLPPRLLPKGSSDEIGDQLHPARALSSAVEHILYTGEVARSIRAAPTIASAVVPAGMSAFRA
jgi:hypothetical protein